MGGPLRRGNCNRPAGWPHAVNAIGASGLHLHDLRHSGNAWAATSGAGLRDLMAGMGHDSERAAIIYQHQARGADAVITNAIDAHADSELRRDGTDDGHADAIAPVGKWHVNGTLATEGLLCGADGLHRMPLTCGYILERVTRIELALSAWESVPFGLSQGVTCWEDTPQGTARYSWLPGLMAR